jgi:putative N6-adenine-specific DNA methylase
MVDLARVRADHTVIDPFCGSGTILIEAARKALGIMPGIDRSFAFEQWSQVDPDIVEAERQRARRKVGRLSWARENATAEIPQLPRNLKS